MSPGLRRFVHRLFLLLTVVTATRGATWSHECVMPSAGHGTTPGPVAAHPAHEGHGGHAGTTHGSTYQHEGAATSPQATIVVSPEAPADHGPDAPHGDCTCIGDCCTTAAATPCVRCAAVPASSVVAHAALAPAGDEERLPPPPAHLLPFANGPPAAPLA